MRMKFIYGLFFLLVGCSTQQAVVSIQDHRMDFEGAALKEGIPAYGETEYVYQKDGKNRFKIDFEEPVVVAVADKPYKWGFFQFPGLYMSDQGEIVARWNMAHDDAESYGKGGHGYAVSKDNGKTWTQADKPPIGGGLALRMVNISIFIPHRLCLGKTCIYPRLSLRLRKLTDVHLGFGKWK